MECQYSERFSARMNMDAVGVPLATQKMWW